jgi:hypothetical protein
MCCHRRSCNRPIFFHLQTRHHLTLRVLQTQARNPFLGEAIQGLVIVASPKPPSALASASVTASSAAASFVAASLIIATSVADMLAVEPSFALASVTVASSWGPSWVTST